MRAEKREKWRRVLLARLGDLVCIVIAFFIGATATEASGLSENEPNFLVGVASLLALWWRRRFPLTVAGISFAATVFAPFAAGAAIASVYTVAAHHRPRTSRIVALLYLLYLCAGAVRIAFFQAHEVNNLTGLLSAMLLTLAAYGWGLAVRSRQEVLTMLAERAERAEADQHARILAARRAERARIAAEMHDVLAHRLSMLSLHAGAIELRPHAPPEDLARSAGVIRSSAHLALDELRGVIGVLRDEELSGLLPPPSAGQLGALLAECQAAGMRIELTDPLPDPAGIPPELGRHLYRIVQEGLTNARKHAPGRTVTLTVRAAPGDGLTVEIGNALTTTPSRVPGAGAGLIGLRERAELAGGTLERRTEDGRHRLRVWLPWPP